MKKNKPKAAIDIGTNSIRILIAELSSSGKMNVLENTGKITQLGEGVDEKKKLSKAPVERSLTVLKDYTELLGRLNISKVEIVATSALRDAENSNWFIKKAEKILKNKIKIISGKEEARLIYKGVSSYKKRKGKVIVIDIGGGSTEIIFGSKGEMENCVSLDLGCVRLRDMFVQNDPIKKDEFEKMDSYLKMFFSDKLKKISTSGRKLIGLGGTITSIAAIDKELEKFEQDKIEGYKLKRTSLNRILKKLKYLECNQISRIKSLEEGRENVIIQGAMILNEFMKAKGFTAIEVSNVGIRYGLLA